MKWDRTIKPVVALIAVGFLWACGETTTVPPGMMPLFAIGDIVDPEPIANALVICKDGSDADFELSHNSHADTVTVTDGTCQEVHGWGEGGIPTPLTVTELPPASDILADIQVQSLDGSPTIDLSNAQVTDVGPGMLLHFFNDELVPGRMTGGGHQLSIDGARVTRGLTIHCDITLSNNLEINWPGGNKWHLEKESLESVECIDDPAFQEEPPRAPFNTFIAEAIGSLNGDDGSIIRFKFIDDGEPGRTDEAHFDIWAPGDDPDVDTPVLSVSGQLDGGNLQAHFDQPHK